MKSFQIFQVRNQLDILRKNSDIKLLNFFFGSVYHYIRYKVLYIKPVGRRQVGRFTDIKDLEARW